jgi:hypothetical protein
MVQDLTTVQEKGGNWRKGEKEVLLFMTFTPFASSFSISPDRFLL